MQSKRITALDGLRGAAILVVVLTHVPCGQIIAGTPKWLQPLLSIIFGNGGTGVAILFILTGFLMASIYPQPKSIISFWGKRFSRLLPLFLVMVTSLSIIRFFPALSWYVRISIILGMTLFARGVWETGVKLSQKLSVGKLLVIGWVSFQAIMAVWYVGYLLRIPASVFFLVWTPLQRAVTTGLVNATLTLPFGQYIGQLDGVYWSLTTEMFFYLIYPFIFVPILQYAKRFSFSHKTILLLTAFPACFGLGVIAKRLLGFEIMSIHMMIYFIVGSMIGSNLEWFQKQVIKAKNLFSNPLASILLLLIVFYGQRLLFPYFSRYYTPVVSLLAVIPIALMLITTTMSDMIVSKWLSHPIFTFLGKISFSLYLMHSSVIDILKPLLRHNSAATEWLFTGITLICSILLSTLTYYLIEKPYYDLKKQKTTPVVVPEITSRHYIWGVSLASLLILFALYTSIKAPTSLFARSVPVNFPSATSLLHGEQPIELTTLPMSVAFTASENNLGMITAHIRSISQDTSTGYPSVPPQLIVTLYDHNQQKLTAAQYKTADIYEDTHHPIGFPIIADSKGKIYTITYQLSHPDPTKKIILVDTGTAIKQVYFVDKSLIHQPVQFARFVIMKFAEPLMVPFFWVIMMYISPFLAVLWQNKKYDL